MENELLSIDLNQVTPYIDISKWWLKDENGHPRSVNSVYTEIRDKYKDCIVTRQTLTNAKNGELEKYDVRTQLKLTKLCQLWSGENVTFGDLVFIKTD